MEKYQSNIFRQAVAVLMMVMAVMCANVALAQTLTIDGSSTVDNSVTATNISVSGITGNSNYYALFYANGDRVSEAQAVQTDTKWWNIPLNEGENTFSLYKVTDSWQFIKDGSALSTVTVTRAASTPAVSFTLSVIFTPTDSSFSFEVFTSAIIC